MMANPTVKMFVLSNIIVFIVDLLSFSLFRAIAVVTVALINTLKAPGAIILVVLENVMQGFTTILDYLIGYVTDLIVKSAFGCMRLILDAFSVLVGSLAAVFYEFWFTCTLPSMPLQSLLGNSCGISYKSWVCHC